jgi:hypothetical protein
MFDIVTCEPEARVVEMAYNTVIHGTSRIVPNPLNNYRFIALGATQTEGNGGNDRSTLVMVGHGDVNGLSGHGNWTAYQEQIGEGILANEYTQVYIVACNTGAEECGKLFGYRNWADTVKAAFPTATVWASATAVNAATLEGTWQQM